MIHKDIISRILEKGESLDNELSTFLDDGVSSILSDRREPYYTIAKNKIKHIISHDNVDGVVRQSYTEQMISTLNGLYFRLPVDDKFSRTFVEICLESVREGEYLTKETLVFLNGLNRLPRG